MTDRSSVAFDALSTECPCQNDGHSADDGRLVASGDEPLSTLRASPTVFGVLPTL